MGKVSQEYAARALEFLIPTMVVDGQERPVIVKGSGIFMEDVEGKQYMDFLAGPGVVATGHCHPEVVAAGQEQLAKLTQTPGAALNPNAISLAERIAGLAPGDLQQTFFCNSGAEANEGAVKLAIKHGFLHGKKGSIVICLENAFHGRLALSLSLTDFDKWKKGLHGFVMDHNIIRVPGSYCYRSSHQSDEECEDASIAAIENAIAEQGAENVVAVIMEPIPGVGGVLVPPDGYHQRVADICQRHDIALIFDEVFTGFGRTGKWFASEHFGAVPDIMPIGKTVGGGLPLGGFVATNKFASAFTAADHNTTFGGNNSVSLAMGLKTLEIIERDNLIDNVLQRGKQIVDGFSALMDSSSIIGEVRGRGLFIGIEIVADRQTKTPGTEQAGKISQYLQDNGIFIGLSGNSVNVLKICPPYVVEEEHVHHFMTLCENALAYAS